MAAPDSEQAALSSIDALHEDQQRRSAICEEAQYIERAAWGWSVIYRRESTWWRRINLSLTMTAAALAATSAATGLTAVAGRPVTALLALGAAIIAALAGTLGASARADTARAAAHSETYVRDAARKFHRTIAPFAPMNEVIEKFNELCESRDKIVANAPGTHLPWLTRRHARLMARYVPISLADALPHRE